MRAGGGRRDQYVVRPRYRRGDDAHGRVRSRGPHRPEDALAFGGVLNFGAVMLHGARGELAGCGLLAFAIAFYIVIYTMWLKRRTPQNIVIGGAAGAFPPMIGWAAVTGNVGW